MRYACSCEADRLILYRNWFWSAHKRPRSGCPIKLTLEALGDLWSLFVIRDLMFGNRPHNGLHWVSMPQGIAHTFRVIGNQPARILTVHDNATFRDFVTELGVPAPEHVVPNPPSFPPMDELIRVASRHDLRPVGPPMSADEAATILASS